MAVLGFSENTLIIQNFVYFCKGLVLKVRHFLQAAKRYALFCPNKQKKAMEIINTINGSFSINPEMVINANSEFTEVISFEIDKSTDDMKNGFEWIYFKNIKIDNFYFFINVCFYQKKMKMINFSFSESKISNTSWKDWNINVEKTNQTKFEKWLKNSIGTKRKFNWGNISSNYDSKSGSTSITINYEF